MKAGKAKISVILPVYNAGNYIKESVQSILNQTYSNFELLILNDGSADNSMDIVNEFRDPRIVLMDDTINRGLVYRLNQGIKMASGEYIARMDADDISTHDRFEKQIRFLENHNSIDIVGSWFQLIGSENTEIVKQPVDDDHIKIKMTDRCPLGHPTLMIRSKVFENNTYNHHSFPVEDYALWVDLMDKIKFSNIPEVLLHYRIHSSSISKEKLTEQKRKHTQVQKRAWEKILLREISPLEFNTLQYLHLNTIRPSYLLLELKKIWNELTHKNQIISSEIFSVFLIKKIKIYIRKLDRYTIKLLSAIFWKAFLSLPFNHQIKFIIKCIKP